MLLILLIAVVIAILILSACNNIVRLGMCKHLIQEHIKHEIVDPELVVRSQRTSKVLLLQATAIIVLLIISIFLNP